MEGCLSALPPWTLSSCLASTVVLCAEVLSKSVSGELEANSRVYSVPLRELSSYVSTVVRALATLVLDDALELQNVCTTIQRTRKEKSESQENRSRKRKEQVQRL